MGGPAYCPSCGSAVSADDHFCASCGHPLRDSFPPAPSVPDAAEAPTEVVAPEWSQERDPDRPRALIIVGYVTAVFLPIVGFILGIVAVTRRNKWASKHGVWIIVVSVVFFAIGVAVITSSINSSVNKARHEISTVEEKAAQESKEAQEKAQQEQSATEAKLKEEQAATEAKAKREQSASEARLSEEEAKTKQEQAATEAKLREEQSATEAKLKEQAASEEKLKRETE